jgi:hypothetical protein
MLRIATLTSDLLARAWNFTKFGIAIAARMPMIATTIINSIRVKARCVARRREFISRRGADYSKIFGPAIFFWPGNAAAVPM